MKKLLIGILIGGIFSTMVVVVMILFFGEEFQSITNVTSESFDVIAHAQKYSLLYSQNISNSLQPECNWDELTYTWNFPDLQEGYIFETTYTTINLDPLSESESEKKYQSEDAAMQAFIDTYPEIEKLSYTYTAKIYSENTVAYTKIPLFSEVNNRKILTTQLGVWRDEEQEYVAGLYETANNFKSFVFDRQDVYFSFPLISEETLTERIENTEVKFLNHEYLCESTSIETTEIDSVEIVYVQSNEYLMPVFHLVGKFSIDSEEVYWSALVNAIDFEALDYSTYYDQDLAFSFVPKPHISQVRREGDHYEVTGYLSNTFKNITIDSKKNFDSVHINLHAPEETGEFVWSDTRQADLQNEINDSLQIDASGAFTFSMDIENFLLVEERMYEDMKGNEIDPVHSSDNEITRPEVFQYFSIQSCGTVQNEEYCSDYSNTETVHDL